MVTIYYDNGITYLPPKEAIDIADFQSPAKLGLIEDEKAEKEENDGEATKSA